MYFDLLSGSDYAMSYSASPRSQLQYKEEASEVSSVFIMENAPKKQKKTMSDEAKKRKREADRARDRTRVTIGTAFTRWRELKDTFGYKFDSQLAIFLLD